MYTGTPKSKIYLHMDQTTKYGTLNTIRSESYRNYYLKHQKCLDIIHVALNFKNIKNLLPVAFYSRNIKFLMFTQLKLVILLIDHLKNKLFNLILIYFKNLVFVYLPVYINFASF